MLKVSTIAKVGWENDADDELAEDSFVRIEDGDAFVAAGPVARGCECLVMGATVWSVHKGIEKSPEPGWNWFDVVLVDEASQLRLPDALIAVAAAKPDANIILAGDDRQLPPIIRGAYPEDHEPMLSSVFGFVRHRAQEREEDDPGALDRALFQLTTNYRMNEPLTAYPRSVLYDRYDSFQPERRMVLTEAPDDPLMSALLDPERPVMLVRYDAPRSFAARNPLEAELAAWIADVVSRTLVDEDTQLVFETEDLIRNGLAVTAPHRAQNAAIREALRQRGFGQDERPMLLVDTVEEAARTGAGGDRRLVWSCRRGVCRRRSRLLVVKQPVQRGIHAGALQADRDLLECRPRRGAGRPAGALGGNDVEGVPLVLPRWKGRIWMGASRTG